MVHLTFIVYSKYTNGIRSIENQLQLVEEKVNLSVNLSTLLSALEKNMEEYFKCVYVIEINKLFTRNTSELYFKVADLLTETSGGWSYLHTHLNSAFGFRHVYKKFAKNNDGLILIPGTSTKKGVESNIKSMTTAKKLKLDPAEIKRNTEKNGTDVSPKVPKVKMPKLAKFSTLPKHLQIPKEAKEPRIPKCIKSKANKEKVSVSKIINTDIKKPKTIVKRGPRGPYKKKDK